ncbi:MAG: hypothetical protein NDJ94_02610 [Vicinamibacteria bacterium]|jgi:glutamyl-tRNA reductase|nr:hypothetical protein [Vicinamibacteria bacterium]
MLILTIDADVLRDPDLDLAGVVEQAARRRARQIVNAELGRACRRRPFTDEQLGVLEAAAIAMTERILSAPVAALRDAPGSPRSGIDWLRIARALGLEESEAPARG